MEEAPNADRPIRVIGRYALYGKLAAGGMAAVHFGRLLGPAGFSRTVAIKRLHAQYAKDPEFVAMFLDEARLAARIQHPNVVATVDVVSMEDELFLVMDYVRGESFSRLLRASRKRNIDVPLGIVGGVVAGMLHGLHAAHEAKDEQGRPLSVVHRDVSPQNVLVGVDGVPRVLDFGVAKAAARIQVTREGQMKGKLAYMAPEQLQAKGVDRRTDIFAAGIVLWEALTGRRLFDAEEASEVLRMILSEDIPPPSAVIPSIPRNVDATVMKALIRDPKARYQTAREFAIALEDSMNPASAREIGEWVERVAGDTLSHREQALAEIEAVSDVSLITDSAPGFMKTLDDISREAKVPDDAGQWDEGPTKIFDPARGVDEEGTRMDNPARRATSGGGAQAPRVDGTSRQGGAGAIDPRLLRADAAPQARVRRGPPTTRLGLGSAKPAVARAASPDNAAQPSADLHNQAPQKPARASGRPSAPPRPSGPRASGAPPARGAPPPRGAEPRMFPPPSEPPPPPAPAPNPAAAFDDENETTHVFDKDRHALDASPSGAAAQAPNQLFGDDETTRVFDKDKHTDDENETTHVFDSDRHGPKRVPVRAGGTKIGLGLPKPPPVPSDRPALPALRTPPPIPPPAPAEKPGLKTIRVERRSERPKPAPAQTVIVQEHTDPAIFRHSDSLWSRAAHWVWDDPAKRGYRVGFPAGVIVFLAVFFAASGHGGRTHRPPSKTAVTELSEEAHDVAPKAAAREEPRGVDPSTLPPADEESEPLEDETSDKKARRRRTSHGTAPAEARIAAVDPAPPSKQASDDPAPTPSPPPPTKPATDDDIESPYDKTAKPSAPTTAAQKPAAKSKKPGAADCSQPFTVDDNGIKRIRPECL
jgi:serine/threonine-protein kinase